MNFTLPARRTFVAIIAISLLLYFGYAYLAIAVAAIYVFAWFVMPVKQPQDFFSGVIPAIDAMAEYLQAMVAAIDQTNLLPTIVQNEYVMVESIFSSRSGYPTWVYYSGFNAGLRSGYRNFLIKLEHAADLCSSLGNWLSKNEDLANQDKFSLALANSLQPSIDLLTALSRTMHHHAEKTLRPVNDANVDFISDLTRLEEALQSLVPGNLELLDLSPEYAVATAMVRDVKDLREVLLVLIAAVPL